MVDEVSEIPNEGLTRLTGPTEGVTQSFIFTLIPVYTPAQRPVSTTVPEAGTTNTTGVCGTPFLMKLTVSENPGIRP